MKPYLMILFYPVIFLQSVHADSQIPKSVEKAMRIEIDRNCLGKASAYQLFDYQVVFDEGVKIHSALMQSPDFEYEGDEESINIIEISPGEFELSDIVCAKDYNKFD